MQTTPSQPEQSARKIKSVANAPEAQSQLQFLSPSAMLIEHDLATGIRSYVHLSVTRCNGIASKVMTVRSFSFHRRDIAHTYS